MHSRGSGAGVDDNGNPFIGWQQRRQRVLGWITNNRQWLESLAGTLSVGFDGSEVTQESLLRFAEQHLVDKIDIIASNTFQNDEVIIRWLASDSNNGQAEQIGLVAPKTTNVLTFRLNEVPAGIEVSPIRPLPTGVGGQPDVFVRPGVKSALNSAAFLIRSVAADALDIDPEEFDICHIRLASLGLDDRGDERFSGEFVIADHLANGSGFTRWLDQNLADNVIGKIMRAADDAFAGRPLAQDSRGEFLCRLFDVSHRQDCDWSCYSCLRNFRNMRFHPLLDWRLATSMIRMLGNAGEQVGLDGNWDKIELAGWIESGWASVDSSCGPSANARKPRKYKVCSASDGISEPGSASKTPDFAATPLLVAESSQKTSEL